MNQKNTEQRRLSLAISLSLLLHLLLYIILLYMSVDWVSLTEIKKEETNPLTLKFNLASRSEPEPEPDAAVEHQEPEPDLVEAAEPAEPEMKAPIEPPVPTEPEAQEDMDVGTDEESGSNNQQNKNSRQILFGDGKPVSKPVEKVSDVEELAASVTPKSKPDTRPVSDTDKTALESGTPITGKTKQEARDGGRPTQATTTDSERAQWSVPESEEPTPRHQQQRRLESGETDAEGDKDRSIETDRSDKKKKLRRSDDEELKAFFGEASSREAPADETVEEVDIPNPETSGEEEQAPGNVSMLDDSQLSETEVEQPFSEKESESLRMRNLIRARNTREIMKHFVNPYKGGKIYKGVIIYDLHKNGYLQKAYVYIPSGLDSLDDAMLDAIRAVERFEVSDDPKSLSNYHEYTTNKIISESMPFEREMKKAKQDTAEHVSAPKQKTSKETP